MAPESKPSAPRRRNPVTRAQIRRDTRWQIAAPLVVAILIVVVLMVLIILPVGAEVRSPAADVSLLLLIIPSALGGLIMLALLVGLNYGVWLGLTRLPPYFKLAQDWVALVGDRIQGGAGSVSNVLLKIRSTVAGVRRAAKNVFGILTFRR